MGVTSKPDVSGPQDADMTNSGESRTVVAEMEAGDVGTIRSVGDGIRKQITSMGVRPGQRLEFHTKQPFDGPVVVSVGRSMTSLSREYARKITVSLE
jgi:Fe2+ transport system protein FeoA